MSIPKAIVISACILSVALLVLFRFSLGDGVVNGRAVRLDRWSGKVVQCGTEHGGSNVLDCAE